jgi:hypothetical protein
MVEATSEVSNCSCTVQVSHLPTATNENVHPKRNA